MQRRAWLGRSPCYLPPCQPGWTVDGHTTAVRTAATWLLAQQAPCTTSWPPYITGTELDDR
ncbi:hypothetical protein Acor_21100 [Acrocarpospora corrugata]|uniref:Uncharacterized protein n=1 Tax=Acrocarpospora corrugata TaxID=35763 RepID=A0A5M3VTB8_9ACTN|nr:hypothetical protein Acor_21100 [Acrocarpospora corrugata]